MSMSMGMHMRAALTRSHSLTTTPVGLLPLLSTWRSISSLSNCSSPHKPRHRPLSTLSPGSRNNSTSPQKLSRSAVKIESNDINRQSVSSFDKFAEQAVQEKTTSSGTPQTEPTYKAPSHNPHLLLLQLFERLVERGLLPQITAQPHSSSSSADGEQVWTVTISLPEWGIDVKGRGSSRLFAEIAAATQFDLALSSPEAVAKLQYYPRSHVSSENANHIVQSYWQFALNSSGPLKHTITKLESGAYEARTYAGSTDIGEPATSAVKKVARGIQNLSLALAVATGHPGLWHAGLQDPFQPKIVLDHPRCEKPQHFITAATDYLRSKPTFSHGSRYEVALKPSSHRTGAIEEGESEAAKQRDIPEINSWLTALPFPPSTAKMLVVAASTRCLEGAILVAAVEKYSVYRDGARRGKEEDGYQNSALSNVMEGDHAGMVLFFKRLREFLRKTPNIEIQNDPGDLSKPNLSAQSQTKSVVTPGANHMPNHHEELSSSTNNYPGLAECPFTIDVESFRRFDHFNPDAMDSVSAAARGIERVLATAGLVSYPEKTSYMSVPGSKLRVRAEPYGGASLSHNLHRNNMLRHLLVLGFPENIAQLGHRSLVPRQPPQLRIDSQDVHIDSPLQAHMPMKQLSKNLKNGGLMVVTGATEPPPGGGLGARYCTPISTWQAVLLGKDLSLPDDSETPVVGAAQVIVNNWLPVLIKSEVEGVSNEQARDMLFEAREVLRRAIDKAIHDYFRFSWQSLDFYKLLDEFPNERRFEAEAQSKEQQDAMGDGARGPTAAAIRHPATPKHEKPRKGK
ncbi:hypothetical protein N8I77_012489 [Diaporthe amygdali]|uniref:Uncharacterized protein n=1 Tax=Phomopsis amygdali TaxID=1214568 RepID=A0AAD9S457_PHOAM|nr:hypothetical protein N8I77_012489 [Diaporthe amygdali]